MKFIFRYFLLLVLFNILSSGYQLHAQYEVLECFDDIPTWHQKAPYNAMLPTFYTENIFGEQTQNTLLIGCSAVAMAQIINYYRSPNSISNTISPYALEFSNAIDNPYVFELDNNSNYQFSWTNGELDEQEKLELIHACALSIGTKFDDKYSSSQFSNIAKALKLYFNFSNTQSSYYLGNCLSIPGFIELDGYGDLFQKIRIEISERRPVMLYGWDSDKKQGHVMIVTGYNPETEFVKLIIGWQDPSLNTWYDLDNIEVGEYNFSNCIMIFTSIVPREYEYSCPILCINDPFTNNEVLQRENMSSVPICPKLVFPNEGEYGATDQIDYRWEHTGDSHGYEVSVHSEELDSLFFNNFHTYANAPYLYFNGFLPFDDTITVTINPIDENGNVISCPDQVYYTDTTLCNVKLTVLDVDCLSDSTFSVEVSLEGLINHTYDLWAEDTAGVLTSFNSVSPESFLLGPFAANTTIFTIVEDESDPYNCFDSDQAVYPNCFECSSIEIAINSLFCQNDSLNLEVHLQMDSSVIADLYTIVPGVNTHNDVESGNYIFYNLPHGENIVIIAEDTSKPFACYNIIVTEGLVCQENPSTTSISKVEYFIDVDPGFGSGDSLVIPNSHDFLINRVITMDSISPGVHVLYIRAQDENGLWGFTHRKLFYVRPESEAENRLLTDLEYFIDTDPGLGSGIPLTLENNTNSIDSYLLPLDTIDPGIHVLYVRGKDNIGNWSFTQRKLFYIRPGDETSNRLLTNLEYFIDTDPGSGMGIPLTLENDTNSIDSYLLPLATINPGIHVLYVRGKDNAGNWSYTSRKLFYIRPGSETSNRLLTNLEYFIDTDPGAGMGITLTLENDTNSIDSYLLPLDTINPGIHVLYVRGKDNAGNWSYTSRKLFYIRPGSDSPNRILTDLEYFIDTDPGFGLGIPLQLDNDTNSIALYDIALDTFTPGLHHLYVRGKDNQGDWGYTIVKPFTIYILGPIVYVDWDATGANIGTSWTNAYNRLEPALMLATLYDTIQEIWIAQGLYKPTSNGDRTISFTWADSTKLYGGFTGTETTRNQRTSDPTLVVLSGDIGISGDSTDNTYHVVVIDSTCQGCYLDRLTIKLGHASGSTNTSDKGAGLHSMGNVEIKDVVVEYNSAASTGAAIYNIGSGADLRMMNCTFRFNDSPNGHDVHNASGANIIIEGNVQIED